MKNLKIKLGLFSLLAVLVVSVFLTSCEQDGIVSINERYDIEASDFENHSENFGIDAYLKSNARFSKIIDIENSAEKKFGVSELGIRITSNDENVLNKFDKNSVIFKYNEVDRSSPVEEDVSLNEESSAEASKWNKDAKLIQIEILGINSDDSYKDNEFTGYVLEFSDEIQSYLKDNNVSMSIDFTGNQQEKGYYQWLMVDKASVTASKYSSAYYYWTYYYNTAPTYYHSYKYFNSYCPSYYPPCQYLSYDDVAVCCLHPHAWKTMKRMYLWNGYIQSISVEPDFCLLNYGGSYGPCYYG